MAAEATDAELVRSTLGGDREAFGRLVERYERVVGALAFQKLLNVADAEDVTQETFVKAYASLRDLRDAARFGTWLYGIALHAATDRLRERARGSGSVSIEALREGGGEPAALGGALPEVERREQARKVQEAVGDLPDKYRIVLTLRYVKLMSYRSIAEHLGEPPGTISNRIHRAVGMLRDRLKALAAP